MKKETSNFYVIRGHIDFLYYFEFLSIRSELLGAGIRGYDSHQEACDIIELVIAQAQKPDCYERKQDKKGNYSFNLKSDKGDVIFKSRKCPTRINLIQTIEQVQTQTLYAKYDKPEPAASQAECDKKDSSRKKYF